MRGKIGLESEKMDQNKTEQIYRTIGNCDVEIPPPCCLIIFGASGDLTKRKLIPALYRLHRHKLLPRAFFVLGASRTEMGDDQFQEAMRTAVKEAVPKEFDEFSWKNFSTRLYYSSIDYSVPEYVRVP